MYGMKVPSRTRNLWKQFRNLADYQGISVSNTTEMMKLGISIGKPEKDIEDAIAWGKTTIISDIVQNHTGEEYSLLDYRKSVMDIEEDIFDKIFETHNEQMHEIFLLVENLFLGRQERIKPYLPALLTLRFFEFLVELENYLTGRSTFIDRSLYNELSKCLRGRKSYPSQQEIAERFKKDKTDASRTTARFLREAQNAIKKCQLVTT